MLQNFLCNPALPEMFLLGMTCVVLLINLYLPQYEQRLSYYLAQITVLGTLLLLVSFYGTATTVVFHNGFILDPVAVLLKTFILISVFFAFIYARPYISERHIPVNEYYVLGLFSLLGMLVLVSSYNFLTLYLGLELNTLPLYAMVALRRDDALATEAAMKYFVMGALASGMLLYGISMLYGATHSLVFTTVAHAIAVTPGPHQLILIFGLVFVFAGLIFKLGAVPFHMWIPDVYQGAPTSVTLFIGSAPKIAALGMAIRILVSAMPGLILQWHEMFIIVAVLSIALGNVVAIVQSNLKRMLSYSAIAHMGYMSLGLLAGTPAGYAAAVFYMINYAIMSLGAFGILILLSRSGIEAEEINDLRGLNARNPWFALMMLLIMFSMAGVPPLVGFFAKLGVLEALIGVHMVWLATLALIFAIIGAYYYLSVVKVMYFEEPEFITPVKTTREMYMAISINGIVLLLLGLFPSSLIGLCRSVFGG